MAEILTESFCERCGTRYTFESTARRASPLDALGTVGRGLRNFVASPDASLDEAFAVARAETEQRATAHQLEAFHQTFNFCLSCRQYTCADCWNPVEGRCLSCSPLPEPEVVTEPASADDALVGFASASATAPWPTIDIGPGPASSDGAEPSAHEVEPTSREAAEPSVSEAPGPEAVPEPDTVARRRSTLPFAPGASLDEEIAAYDLRIAALAKAPPEPQLAPAPEPIAPQPPATPAMPVAPAAPIVAPAAPPPAAPIVVPPASRQSVARGPVQMAAPPRTVVPDLPPPEASSDPAVASTGTCPSCGLSLSASARFCRRCGTQQRV